MRFIIFSTEYDIYVFSVAVQFFSLEDLSFLILITTKKTNYKLKTCDTESRLRVPGVGDRKQREGGIRKKHEDYIEIYSLS